MECFGSRESAYPVLSADAGSLPRSKRLCSLNVSVGTLYNKVRACWLTMTLAQFSRESSGIGSLQKLKRPCLSLPENVAPKALVS